MNSIRDNFLRVKQRIAQSAERCGRKPEDIMLVVVTKTQPIESIVEVIKAGALDLGENYIEDAIPKIIALQGQNYLKWHMIGHVQSRKAEQVANHFQFLHSLDSYKLAEKINRHLVESDNYLHAWLEFNVSGEQTKSGWDIYTREKWSELLGEIARIYSLPRLYLRGVMAMPPYSENPEDARPYFIKLKEFHGYVIDQLKPSGFRELSMGMSGDFEVAIQEGSTCVRIGQAIFGPRIA